MRCVQGALACLVLCRCKMVTVGMITMITMPVIMLEDEEEVETGGREGEKGQEEPSLISPHLSLR